MTCGRAPPDRLQQFEGRGNRDEQLHGDGVRRQRGDAARRRQCLPLRRLGPGRDDQRKLHRGRRCAVRVGKLAGHDLNCDE